MEEEKKNVLERRGRGREVTDGRSFN